MGLFNRRYAALGWIVWRIVKRSARKRAKNVVPGRASSSRRLSTSRMLALGGLAAAIGSAVWFWRRGDGDDDWPDSVERP